jgi:hypothetical protein
MNGPDRKIGAVFVAKIDKIVLGICRVLDTFVRNLADTAFSEAVPVISIKSNGVDSPTLVQVRDRLSGFGLFPDRAVFQEIIAAGP